MASLLGTTAITGDGTQPSNNFNIYQQFTAKASGTVTQINVNCFQSGNIKVAIYTDDGVGSGLPNTLLASTGSNAVVSGINSISISSVSVINGTKYWLAYGQDAGKPMIVNGAAAGNRGGFASNAFTNAFPSTADNISGAINSWGNAIEGLGTLAPTLLPRLALLGIG